MITTLDIYLISYETLAVGGRSSSIVKLKVGLSVKYSLWYNVISCFQKEY